MILASFLLHLGASFLVSLVAEEDCDSKNAGAGVAEGVGEEMLGREQEVEGEDMLETGQKVKSYDSKIETKARHDFVAFEPLEQGDALTNRNPLREQLHGHLLCQPAADEQACCQLPVHLHRMKPLKQQQQQLDSEVQAIEPFELLLLPSHNF